MTTASRYRLVRQIATGGSAEILEAVLEVPEGFSRRVAVKRLLPAVAADPSYVNAFLDEARITSLLQHPHVAAVIDFGQLEGAPAQVLELIEGLNAAQLVRELGPVSPWAALEIVVALTTALAYAHEATDLEGRPLGVVHRDISPDNVMLGWNGDIKLIDFGIALAHRRKSATAVGVVKGKLDYMAPEQYQASDVDARADLFSTGCLLHFLLTGRSAVMGRTVGHEGKIEVDAKVPRGIADCIRQATHWDRNRRYANAQAMLEEVDRLLTAERQARKGERLTNLVQALMRTQIQPLEFPPTATLVSFREEAYTRTSTDRTLTNSSLTPTPLTGSPEDGLTRTPLTGAPEDGPTYSPTAPLADGRARRAALNWREWVAVLGLLIGVTALAYALWMRDSWTPRVLPALRAEAPPRVVPGPVPPEPPPPPSSPPATVAPEPTPTTRRAPRAKPPTKTGGSVEWPQLVREALSQQGISLSDVSESGANQEVSDYLRAVERGEEAAIRAAGPPLIERIAQAGADPKLLRARLKRLGPALQAGMGSLPPEERSKLERTYLDLKMELLPRLSPEKTRELMQRTSALERALNLPK